MLVVAPLAPPPPPIRRPDTGAANSLVPTDAGARRPPDRGGQARPELSSEERAHAEKMIAQGERYLSQGNVAIARQFFQRAAEAGLCTGSDPARRNLRPVGARAPAGAGRRARPSRSPQMVRARQGAWSA